MHLAPSVLPNLNPFIGVYQQLTDRQPGSDVRAGVRGQGADRVPAAEEADGAEEAHKPLKQLSTLLYPMLDLKTFLLTEGHQYCDDTMLQNALQIIQDNQNLKQINIRWVKEKSPNHLKQEGTYDFEKVISSPEGEASVETVTGVGWPEDPFRMSNTSSDIFHPRGHEDDAPRSFLSGYSVALDLKKTDYLVVDDRHSHQAASARTPTPASVNYLIKTYGLDPSNIDLNTPLTDDEIRATWVTHYDIQTRQYRCPEDEDKGHLAQIVELMGEIARSIALGGKYSAEFFNRKGELRHINKLRYWPLDAVLHDKYLFLRHEVDSIASFLNAMLRLHPDKRAKASELVHHNFLDGIMVQGEIDAIRRLEMEESQKVGGRSANAPAVNGNAAAGTSARPNAALGAQQKLNAFLN
ncbi:hypothetical protein AX16_006629 [Volvariella volvacea WC 439]|nr:hypothetical protein AX16_006629 [Volvariella volvacea WC 439]